MTLTEFLLARVLEDETVASEMYRRVAGFPRRNGKAAARRMVLECASKRRIMELHSDCEDVSYGDPSTCPTMTALAAAYAGHPEFREEWRI